MLYAIAALIILIIDQGLKYWTTVNLTLNTGIKELIPGVMHLTNIHNTGSAFGLLEKWAGARWLFLAITVLFAAVCIWALAAKKIRAPLGRWTVILVLAGAIGNGIDRAIQGYVVDMFAFEGLLDWFPIFNVADIALVVGAIAFCLYILFHKEPIAAPSSDGARAPRQKAARPAARGTEPAGRRPTPRAVQEQQTQARQQQARDAAAKPSRPKSSPGPQTPVPARPAAPKQTPAAKPRQENPFAEWEQPRVQTPPPPTGKAAQALAEEKPGQRPAPPRPRQSAPESRPAPVPMAPAEVQSPAVDPTALPQRDREADARKSRVQVGEEVVEFSLEDILSEFGDR